MVLSLTFFEDEAEGAVLARDLDWEFPSVARIMRGRRETEGVVVAVMVWSSGVEVVVS